LLLFQSAAYGQSKFANILFSNELARRAQASGSGITANSLHPGFITTDLMRHVEQQFSSMGEVLAAVMAAGQKWVFSAAMVADDGALTQVLIAS
jgi:NAD(P)-dependent dehydrogenase (short-subunit alcohol dehydrogenase family)